MPLTTTLGRRSRHSSSPSSKDTLRSTSRPPLTIIPPNRLLRYLRFLFYCWAAPNFLYSLYVQIIVLKGPGRTPLPASVNFGRDTLFLTFHGNFHCTWYACLCLLHSFLSLDVYNQNRRRSRAAKSIEATVHRFTPVLFPLAAFVGLAYYLILHFHPMNRLRAQLVPDHDAKMALLHLNPLLFVLADSLLKDAELLARYAFKQRKAVRYISIYGTCYFLWTLFCTRLNGGNWPYPFQKHFTPIQHIIFLFLSVSSSIYLTRTGFRFHGRIDRRRRRRIAAAAERNLSTTEKISVNNNTGKTQTRTSCI